MTELTTEQVQLAQMTVEELVRLLEAERTESAAQQREITEFAREQSQRVHDLRDAMARTDHEICQILGVALGYPRYCDDPKKFPDATAADGVCVGDHVASSLAAEAADRIRKLEAEIAARKAYDTANPLGGPANILLAAAGRVMAGENYDAVLKDSGLVQKEREA